MTLNADNIKKNNDDSCCCSVVDSLQDWWNVNKYRVSAPLAVGLSVCGGVGSVLSAYSIIGTSVVIGVTNVGIFFSGIALSAFSSENKKLSKDNISLCNEKNDIVRRLTMAYPHLNESRSVSERSDDSVEPVNFEHVHKNNVFQSSIKAFNFPEE
jgi:hypothetical protein